MKHRPTPGLRVIELRVKDILKDIQLDNVISIQEIRDTLLSNDKIFDSPLLLGVISRIFQDEKEKLLAEIIHLLTEWKNFLPARDLGGLSPREFVERYPRGEHERKIMDDLLHTYMERLELHANLREKGFRVSEDFKTFQKEFLNLVPAMQSLRSSRLLTNREIIIEERRKLHHPVNLREKIGISLFADNVSGSIREGLNQVEKSYEEVLHALLEMQNGRKKRSVRLVRKLLYDLIALEPYMKCHREAFRFYHNLGNTAFLADEMELAVRLYRHSLVLNPQYREARETLRRIESYLGSLTRGDKND